MGQGYVFKNIMRWLSIRSSTTQTVIHYTQWLVVVLLLVYSIGYIYKYGPTVTKRWRLASPGAIFATLLISFATLIFAYWAQNISTYSKVYGSIGSILIIMTLIFIIALIILIGFELNVSISVLKATAAARERAEHLAVNEAAQLRQHG
jgi:membrane protein